MKEVKQKVKYVGKVHAGAYTSCVDYVCEDTFERLVLYTRSFNTEKETQDFRQKLIEKSNKI